SSVQLGNFVEIAKQLSVPAGEGWCKVHQEPFKLFCNQDQMLICVICRESQAHRAHLVVPTEEAAQTYKVGLCCGKIEAERQKIVSEFEQLRQFLEEQERLLLAQLEELDKEIVKIQDENVTKLSEEISHLSDLITPLNSGEAVLYLDRKGIRVSRRVRAWVSAAVWTDLNTLSSCLSFSPLAVQATPDPDLANPCSLLSREESVIYKHTEILEHRFHPAACVLGYKGFTSGRCYWEVEVGNKHLWVLGIAKESVIQKGTRSRTPEKGIWALQSTGNEYLALTSPKTALDLPRSPSSIGVYLDYEGEKVTFYDITSSGRETIFTFTSSFTGKIIPFFGSQRVEYPNLGSSDPWNAYH
uniref:Uncharacterized protein n=1 Tax=Chrysemys picta bellii TaxID=8478 RepID=A0A8C3HSN2_CHRPI